MGNVKNWHIYLFSAHAASTILVTTGMGHTNNPEITPMIHILFTIVYYYEFLVDKDKFKWTGNLQVRVQ